MPMFLYRVYKQIISRDWTYAPAVAQFVHNPPNWFAHGGGGPHLANWTVKQIRAIRQTLLVQTSVVKLHQGAHVVFQIYSQWRWCLFSRPWNDWSSGSPGKVRLLPSPPLLCFVFFVLIFIIQVILHFYIQINDTKEHKPAMKKVFLVLGCTPYNCLE